MKLQTLGVLTIGGGHSLPISPSVALLGKTR